MNGLDTRAIFMRTELEVWKSLFQIFFCFIQLLHGETAIVHILSRFPLLLFNF